MQLLVKHVKLLTMKWIIHAFDDWRTTMDKEEEEEEGKSPEKQLMIACNSNHEIMIA